MATSPIKFFPRERVPLNDSSDIESKIQDLEEELSLKMSKLSSHKREGFKTYLRAGLKGLLMELRQLNRSGRSTHEINQKIESFKTSAAAYFASCERFDQQSRETESKWDSRLTEMESRIFDSDLPHSIIMDPETFTAVLATPEMERADIESQMLGARGLSVVGDVLTLPLVTAAEAVIATYPETCHAAAQTVKAMVPAPVKKWVKDVRERAEKASNKRIAAHTKLGIPKERAEQFEKDRLSATLTAIGGHSMVGSAARGIAAGARGLNNIAKMATRAAKPRVGAAIKFAPSDELLNASSIKIGPGVEYLVPPLSRSQSLKVVSNTIQAAKKATPRPVLATAEIAKTAARNMLVASAGTHLTLEGTAAQGTAPIDVLKGAILRPENGRLVPKSPKLTPGDLGLLTNGRIIVDGSISLQRDVLHVNIDKILIPKNLPTGTLESAITSLKHIAQHNGARRLRVKADIATIFEGAVDPIKQKVIRNPIYVWEPHLDSYLLKGLSLEEKYKLQQVALKSNMRIVPTSTEFIASKVNRGTRSALLGNELSRLAGFKTALPVFDWPKGAPNNLNHFLRHCEKLEFKKGGLGPNQNGSMYGLLLHMPIENGLFFVLRQSKLGLPDKITSYIHQHRRHHGGGLVHSKNLQAPERRKHLIEMMRTHAKNAGQQRLYIAWDPAHIHNLATLLEAEKIPILGINSLPVSILRKPMAVVEIPVPR